MDMLKIVCKSTYKKKNKSQQESMERTATGAANQHFSAECSFFIEYSTYKFIKQMRPLRDPLDTLLKKDQKWNWTSICQKHFEKFKKLLSSELLLTHFDPKLPIKVAADAASVGIGAYICHISRWQRKGNFSFFTCTHSSRKELLTNRKRRSSISFRSNEVSQILI